ncbi:MAG TPA: head GIN domain-containing protein [Chitinophagaceae bacterium]|nr:head GIN domain-containing protein [Chitinophagaceae bacterium]
MKKLLVGLFALISLNSFSQVWVKVKGDGHLKTETRQVSDFTSLSSHGPMDVQINYGSSNSITVEADENLLPYIETVVENGNLEIRTKKNTNIKSKSRMVITVSMTKINGLQLSGSGDIKGDGAFTNNSETDIAVSGSGNITLGFDNFKDLDVAVSGSGNVHLKGNGTNKISAHVSGSGNIDCSNINSSDVAAKLSGSGNIKVYASNSIDAKISGSGNVFYKGDATKIESKVSGSGKVVKM